MDALNAYFAVVLGIKVFYWHINDRHSQYSVQTPQNRVFIVFVSCVVALFKVGVLELL